MYHAPDGFVGTYDQVVAHEKKHNLDCEHQDDPPPGWAAPIANDPVGKMFESVGFRVRVGV